MKTCALKFSEWLLVEGKRWEAIKHTFDKRRKGLECEVKKDSKDEKKDLMFKLLATKDRKGIVKIVKEMQGKNLRVHNGQVEDKKTDSENLQKWMYETININMKSFSEYYEQRLNEMAGKKKKKSKPVVMPNEDDNKLIIKGKIGPAGHQQLTFRTGANAQGEKRLRTRSAQKEKAIREFD